MTRQGMNTDDAGSQDPFDPGPRLRVALVYDDTMDRYGGVAQYCLTLGAYLRSQGHHVDLLVGQTTASHIDGIAVRSMSKNFRVKFNGNALSIPLTASKTQVSQVSGGTYDVVHVQMPYSPLMAGRVIRALAPGTAVVATFHVASERRLARVGGRFLAVWCRATTRRIDRVVSVSRAAEDFARGAFGITQFMRIPNMTPVGEPSTRIPQNATPIVAFVGRLEERKGVKQLLAEFATVVTVVPDATLLVAGDGSQASELRHFASTLGIEDNVHFLGAIDNRARTLLLATADVACFPSTFGESFGIVLIEAMAAGAGAVLGGNNAGHRAVLSAHTPGRSEPDREVVAPTIVDARTDGDIARKIIRLLTDSHLRSRVHRHQQQLVRQYDSEAVCSELLDLYREVLSSHLSSVEPDRDAQVIVSQTAP